jgi:outer membrane protein TolC
MKNHPLLTTLLLALAFAGCMVGPDYKPPKTQTPPAWASVTNSTAADTRLTRQRGWNLARWWSRFPGPRADRVGQRRPPHQFGRAPGRSAAARGHAPPAARMPAVSGPQLTATGSGRPHRLCHAAARTPADRPGGVLAGGRVGSVWNLDFFGAHAPAA